MKRIAREKGNDTDTSRDFDYTDWDGVRRFAEEFLTTLVTEQDQTGAEQIVFNLRPSRGVTMAR